MTSWRLGLIVCLFALASPISFAATSTWGELVAMGGSLGTEFKVLRDEQGSLQLEEVIAKARDGEYMRVNQPVVNLGFDAVVHWFVLDFEVQPEDLMRRWLADIDYPVLDRVDLYLLSRGEPLLALKSGDDIPPSARPISARTLAFPLRFPEPGEYQLLLRLDSQSSQTLPLRLLSGENFSQRSDRFSFWMGMYFGVTAITVLFSALVALITRAGLFFDYSAFVLCAGVGLPLSLTGYGSQYLWGEWPWLSDAMTPISMGIALFFALSLTRKTLALSEIGERLAVVLKFEQLICLGVAMSVLFVEYALSIRFGTAMGAVAAVSVITASLRALVHNRRTAQLFFFAWSWYLVAVLVKAGTVFGFFPFNTLTNYAMQSGLSVLIIFLAAALGDLLNTERRRLLDAQLQSMRDTNDRRQAELAAKTRTEFLAKMSHELRTPMNAVIGFSELGLRKGSENKRAEYLAQIHAAAKGLLALINEILDFSKIEAGRLKLENTAVSLPQLFDKISSMFQLQADKKDIGFIVDYPAEMPEWVLADGLRLEQVLNNLISNAIKFTQSGGVEVLVSQEQDAQGQWLRVRVRDTGVGIREEDRARLFEAFSQADDSITRRFGGTGLGLVISQQLMQLMGGEIGLDSQAGEGSEAWIRMPLKAASAGSAERGRVANADTAYEIKGGEELAGLRVLLAEDNELNQKLVQELLSDFEVQLHTVENGRLAVEAASDRDFDLVLMDVFMPEMDGYSATRAIRAIPHLAELPIIAVSASVADHDQKSCFDAGMTDFVAKPIQPQILINSMLRHAGREWAVPLNSEAAVVPTVKNDSKSVFVPELGLRYCNNDQSLFQKLLQDFLKHYAQAAEQLAEHLSRDDIAEARRLAHTVKGLAASLGLEILRSAAWAVENGCRDQTPTAATQKSFSTELTRARQAVTAYLDQRP